MAYEGSLHFLTFLMLERTRMKGKLQLMQIPVRMVQQIR